MTGWPLLSRPSCAVAVAAPAAVAAAPAAGSVGDARPDAVARFAGARAVARTASARPLLLLLLPLRRRLLLLLLLLRILLRCLMPRIAGGVHAEPAAGSSERDLRLGGDELGAEGGTARRDDDARHAGADKGRSGSGAARRARWGGQAEGLGFRSVCGDHTMGHTSRHRLPASGRSTYLIQLCRSRRRNDRPTI
eukprot:362480-Chlamydomonas_euryale.AAC.6